MEIVYRPLTPDEARLLHHELRTTPNIIGYTTGELRAKRDVFVGEIGGRFAGLFFSVDLPFGWTELAVLYVLPEFRGHGLGRALFDAAFQRAEERKRHILILSRNPAVVGWMREKGMDVTAVGIKAPLAYHLHSLVYMAHPYRNLEAFRKLPQMLKGPPLMQGTNRADR
jgi:GNAT superfamily N-acetyltransferase